MKPHTVLDSKARELAALHTLSALNPAEVDAYEVHLASCRVCRQEVEALRAAAFELALLAPTEAPPAELKSRLMERVRNESRAASPDPSHPAAAPAARPWQVWSNAVAGGTFTLERAQAAIWESTGFEGVEARRLLVDNANDRVTMLIRMSAGASYPSHRHGGPEECFVIEGDLRTGAVTMNAGDYKFSEAGSLDETQSTQQGCLLLIVSSLHDELTNEAGHT